MVKRLDSSQLLGFDSNSTTYQLCGNDKILKLSEPRLWNRDSNSIYPRVFMRIREANRCKVLRLCLASHQNVILYWSNGESPEHRNFCPWRVEVIQLPAVDVFTHLPVWLGRYEGWTIRYSVSPLRGLGGLRIPIPLIMIWFSGSQPPPQSHQGAHLASPHENKRYF